MLGFKLAALASIIYCRLTRPAKYAQPRWGSARTAYTARYARQTFRLPLLATLGAYNMRVYYFTSEEFALSNIINERIKVSLLDDLNDPYEFMGVDISDKEFRKAFNAGREEAAKTAGVICFSKCWKNPLMWGHYGNKHKGICLGFDIEDEHIKEVDYVPELLKPDIDMKKKLGGLTEDFIENIFRLKYEGWAYENEVRVLVPLEERDPSGYYFTDFEGNMQLREVILGQKASTTIDQVKKHLCSYKSQIRVFKSRIAFTKYEVVHQNLVTEYIHGA